MATTLYQSATRIVLFANALVLTAFLGGCGGGDSSTGATLTFTGVVTQATITQPNGEDIVQNAYQAGANGNTLGNSAGNIPTSIQAAGHDTPSRPLPIMVAQPLMSGLKQVLANQPQSNSVVAVNFSTTVAGSCGGALNYSMNLNETTFDMNGMVNYDNFCEADVTTSGTVTTSVNLISGAANMAFNGLTTSTGNRSYTSDGTIAFNYYDYLLNSVTITMNMLMRDNVLDKVFKTEDYIIDLSFGPDLDADQIPDYVDASYSGRFYHPAYGYVDITTPTVIRTYAVDTWPTSGVLVATGAGGATVTLTALSNTSYQVDIDEDGISPVEYTNTGNWSAL